MPRVSVLLPTLNAATHLGAALDSLRHQTFADFEVLLVDDGSEDDTPTVAQQLWGNDSRLRIIEAGRVGLIEALQQGLHACKGELVARMDADDIAAPQRFSRQVAWLDNQPEVALVGCLVKCFAAEGIGEGYRLYEEWVNGLIDHDPIVREIFVESPLPHPSVMFRKEIILDAGGYRDCGWPEDYDLWLRLANRGARFSKVPEVLLRWRDTPGRHSRAHERYSQDAFLRCKAEHLAAGPLAGRNEIVIWGAGQIGRRLAKYLAEHDVCAAAFVDIDPKKIGRNLHGAPIIAPESLQEFRDRFLVAAVGSRGARLLIRQRLHDMGWHEGVDFLAAA